MTQRLNGLGVLITRPIVQAQKLAEKIRAANGEALVFPTIDIADVENTAPVNALLNQLENFDWAVFISANAVEKMFSLWAARRPWPDTLRVAAVGAATADALRERGVKNIVSPATQFDSEALLALPELQDLKARRVIIFRGAGGRETLAQTLTARGAQVVYCECYRRLLPTHDGEAVREWLRQNRIHAIDVMSGESLTNLLLLAGEASPALKKIPLVVHHQRVYEMAGSIGFTLKLLCPPGDAALIDVLAALSLGKLTPIR